MRIAILGAGKLGIRIAEAIIKAKPAAAKGRYLKSVTVASTMGPGIKINGQKLMEK